MKDDQDPSKTSLECYSKILRSAVYLPAFRHIKSVLLNVGCQIYLFQIFIDAEFSTWNQPKI